MIGSVRPIGPISLADAAWYAMAFAVVLSASWVCDDARDRLPNAEAFLWTGLVLLTGLFAAVTRRVSDAAFVLYALSLYGARTRGRSWWAVRNGRRSR